MSPRAGRGRSVEFVLKGSGCRIGRLCAAAAPLSGAATCGDGVDLDWDRYCRMSLEEESFGSIHPGRMDQRWKQESREKGGDHEAKHGKCLIACFVRLSSRQC